MPKKSAVQALPCYGGPYDGGKLIPDKTGEAVVSLEPYAYHGGATSSFVEWIACKRAVAFIDVHYKMLATHNALIYCYTTRRCQI